MMIFSLLFQFSSTTLVYSFQKGDNILTNFYGFLKDYFMNPVIQISLVFTT